MTKDAIIDEAKTLFAKLRDLNTPTRVETINALRLELHQHSPFVAEPVDCVQWVRGDMVEANDYNPNYVAPPEMELLKQSVLSDGFTQPIVSWKTENKIEVVDGFHRNRVGKEVEEIKRRTLGYLPVVNINQVRQEKDDRMASTIRHNRARGTHNVELMSSIVAELVEMGKGDPWICKHIGMSIDEVLRLKQITGVAALFKNRDFSDSWEADGEARGDNTEDFMEQRE
jgi:ParB-like chromosome segregation protein Spo0J